MIIGAHVIIQSKNASADRAFLNRLTLPSVPMADGFTIYGLPPAKSRYIRRTRTMCTNSI